MKLSIIIEGTADEIDEIAGHFSDGGGEEGMLPAALQDDGVCLVFDYSKCFPAHGYDVKKDGPDLVITGKIVKEE